MVKRTEHDHGGYTGTHVGHHHPDEVGVSHHMPQTPGREGHHHPDHVQKHHVEGPHHANVHDIPTKVHHHPGHSAEHPGKHEDGDEFPGGY